MSGTCFYPSGSQSAGGYPCSNATTGHTACCGMGHFCASNGLCIARDATIYRGSCTDPTWQSPECPDFCVEQQRDNLAPMQACGTNRFSCTGACSQNQNIVTLVEASQVTAVTGTTSDTAPSPSDTQSSATAQASCSATVGEVAGVGAGVGVPLLLALLAALFLYYRERKRNRRTGNDHAVEADDTEKSRYSVAEPSVNTLVGSDRVSKGAKDVTPELPIEHQYGELEGTIPPAGPTKYR